MTIQVKRDGDDTPAECGVFFTGEVTPRTAGVLSRLLVSFLLVLFVPGKATCQDTPPPQRSRFESGLSSELLDDLRPARPEKPSDSRTPRVGEDLGEASERDPLREIGSQMQNVANRLQGTQVDGETRNLQADIVAALDQLIDQLDTSNSQQQQPQQQSQQQQASSAATSQTAAEQASSESETNSDCNDDEKVLRASMKAVWGQLPEKLREQIQSPLREEFLPAYRQLIVDYYNQLSKKP